MDFVEQFSKNNNNFSQKIKASKYIESLNKIIAKEKIEDICEIIIGKNDLFYGTLSKKYEKEKYINDKKLELASKINISDKEKYIKKWKTNIIQNGFQSTNSLSSILYMNDYYKINCVIFNKEDNIYYQTTLKEYPKLFCTYENGSWKNLDIENDIPSNLSTDISDLKTILNMDINTIFILQPYLENISKYKIKDLEKISLEKDISLIKDNGKKKIKKELYDDINLKHYIQDI